MINIDELKKKIIYRSNYRGTKEMDKLLSSFTTKYIDELDKQDLLDLENLLKIDDSNLFAFFRGSNVNVKIDHNKVSQLFKNFKYENFNDN